MDLIEKKTISSYSELIKIIKRSKINFREHFIFRGIGDINYELIPGAFRKNDNGEYMIKEFIDSKLLFKGPLSAFINVLSISNQDYKKLNKNPDKDVIFDKYGRLNSKSENEIHEINDEKSALFKKEIYILLRFLDWADKSGLKISVKQEMRELLHKHRHSFPKNFKWPNPDYFEIISHAQHYGLPTEALDWSYNYKVALYFAVKNILQKNKQDGVLWALNYKYLEEIYTNEVEGESKLKFYRPEYNVNPYLKAQKGLFTFIINDIYEFDERPLDKIITKELEDIINTKNKGLKDFTLKNEKLFYKFIIPNRIKHKILKELYLEGYSEEFLFPDYRGVVLAMENRVKFDDYYNDYLKKPKKKDILMSFTEKEAKKIKNKENKVIFLNSGIKKPTDKIFIHINKTKEVIGFFKMKQITKYTSRELWDVFSENTTFSKNDFKYAFKGKKEGFVIKIHNLEIFKYPIGLNDFHPKNKFCYIQGKPNLEFLLNFK